MLIIPIVVFIYCYRENRNRAHYLLLSDVIPGATVVSQEDGIVEYKGKRFILGSTRFAEKKKFIEHLRLLKLTDSVEIDMSFDSQIIFRPIKKSARRK